MDSKPKTKFIVNTINNYQYIKYDNDNSMLRPIANHKTNKSNYISNDIKFYYHNMSGSAGRGFGDINISNNLHYSDSRKTVIENPQNYHINRIMNINHLSDNVIQTINPHNINDVPRGGENTRKTTSLTIDRVLPKHFSIQTDKPKIKFNYD
jgi:hypothetical protein